MELIRLSDVHKTYHVGEIDVPVLRGVSLVVEQGDMVALMGASGCGKTTLMNLLGCLDRPSSGEYWLDGEEISALGADARADIRNRKIGFVFQNFNLLARTTAVDNVLMPLEYARSTPPEASVREHAENLLRRVQLGTRLDHVPAQMSGGQQQRVALARSLVNQPPLLLADEPTGNLDSKTTVEILALLQQLNADGITIILVTHDHNVARHAKRIVWMKDGRVESEERNEPLQASAPTASEPAKTPAGGRAWRPRLLPNWLATPLKALQRNSLRSALTTLGIVIGVSAVITMMEIGGGSRKAMQATIASMGANNLLIQPGAAASGGVTLGSGSALTLTPGDADELERKADALNQVAPIVRARSQIVSGNRNWVPLYIYGTTPEFLEIRDWLPLESGSAFTDRDVRNQGRVCLVGATIVRELFQGEDPVGREIRIQNVAFRIIGVLTPKGANMMGLDQDDIVLAPWTSVKYRVSGNTLANVNQSASVTTTDPSQKVNSLNQLYPGRANLYTTPSISQLTNTPQPVRFVNVDQLLTRATSVDSIPQAIRQITTILRERHRLGPDEPDDFNIRDMTESTKALESTQNLMGTLLLAVALISLVVGGVGIMNIMLVSVTERTREIGLRMAVGARGRQILRQFLVESIVLCLLGGAMGIGLGRLASFLVATLLRWPTEISLPAMIASVAVSATVGILFGFYPAWKASRLDPIEALRYE